METSRIFECPFCGAEYPLAIRWPPCEVAAMSLAVTIECPCGATFQTGTADEVETDEGD